MFERFRQRRIIVESMIRIDQNKQEMIRTLEHELSEKYGEIFRSDMEGKGRADEIERLKPSRDFLHYLKQEQLREKLLHAGIKVPDEFGTPYNDDVLLTKKGEEWATIQVRKYREQRIEFWVKLVMPVLSLIVSIVALYISTHNHK
jgi:hypothetical protein